MKQHTLASLLLPEYRRKILCLLLLHPDSELHGREIARRTSLAPGTVLRELKALSEVGLLARSARGNQVAFRANLECPVHHELASILRKTAGVADLIASALVPLLGRLRVVFVYGSVAKGREVAGSDLDLMLIGDVTFREVVEQTHAIQPVLGREINPKVLSVGEFSRLVASDAFLKDVVAGPKIFVHGGESDLEELAGHKSGGHAYGRSSAGKAARRRTAKSR